jgi:hypothetical protein
MKIENFEVGGGDSNVRYFNHTLLYFTIISNCRKSLTYRYSLNELNAERFHLQHISFINLKSYTGMKSKKLSHANVPFCRPGAGKTLLKRT